jgi:DNA helicase II / ATP-dependent DNA helicase PcrA
MVARRLGFATLYSAFNDEATEALKAAFMEATAWPLRRFTQVVVPLAGAVRAGKEFDAMAIVRAHPLARLESLIYAAINVIVLSW